jgi:hypothetical protein
LSSEKFENLRCEKFEMPVGLRLGEEKGIKTKVREVYDISQKRGTGTL